MAALIYCDWGNVHYAGPKRLRARDRLITDSVAEVDNG